MKKLLSLMLALCLVLTLAVPAFAADSMDNFQKVKTYENNFKDVPENHWAASSISACYEYGLMNGADSTTFNLSGTLTVAEALVMAAQVNQVYKTGATAVQPAEEGIWYQPFVDYCVESEIIKADTFSDYNATATRAQMAGIFAHALPTSGFAGISSFTPPDVTGATPYRDEILTLYAAGILSGSDDYGTFHPDNTISRAEAAVILSRVALSANRSVKVLLKDISLGNGVTAAVPQDVKNLSDSSDVNSYEYSSDMAFVSTQFEYNELYRAFDIGFLGDYFNDILPELLDSALEGSSNAEVKTMNSTSVQFGDQKAIRVTCTVTSEGETLEMVMYLYTSENMLGMVMVGTDNDLALANTIANTVRVNGAGVSPKL